MIRRFSLPGRLDDGSLEVLDTPVGARNRPRPGLCGQEGLGLSDVGRWTEIPRFLCPRIGFDILNNHVLPFLEKHSVKIETALSDNGREYCGREDRHPYRLFLQPEDIEHRKTKVGRPQSNGFIERFHRTLLDEHLRVKGRTTWYESVDEMRTDLDAYLETYNRNRPHRGRGMDGRPPYRVFRKGIRKPRSRKKSTRKEVKTAARSADLGEAGCQVIGVLARSAPCGTRPYPTVYAFAKQLHLLRCAIWLTPRL